MTSSTNTVRYYTDPDSCPYAKSDNTGCTALVMWRCGRNGSMGIPPELRDKDKDGFPLIRDYTTPVKRDRIPDREFEPEKYRKYINAQKDRGWAAAMQEPSSQIQKLGPTAEQIMQIESATKKHYIKRICMCGAEINRERGYDSSWKEIV